MARRVKAVSKEAVKRWEKGEKPSAIADALNVSRTTVYAFIWEVHGKGAKRPSKESVAA
jgi:DNA-binding transcriptional regulator YiaG